VAKALPESSATKERTRSLVSASSAPGYPHISIGEPADDRRAQPEKLRVGQSLDGERPFRPDGIEGRCADEGSARDVRRFHFFSH
jgi:hypothetical protein